MEIVRKYFPGLSAVQEARFGALGELYAYWNARINVISRKDIGQLYERHVLHSLAIAKVLHFKEGTAVADAGTGGGFPGIPLAIFFPEVRFHLVDSIGKKIKVVEEVARRLGLENVTISKQRIEETGLQVDFVVSRAVTRLPDFYPWVKDKVRAASFNDLANGILYLKGGDLAEEIAALGRPVISYPLSRFFMEPFFETKYCLHLPVP